MKYFLHFASILIIISVVLSALMSFILGLQLLALSANLAFGSLIMRLFSAQLLIVQLLLNSHKLSLSFISTILVRHHQIPFLQNPLHLFSYPLSFYFSFFLFLMFELSPHLQFL